MKLSIIILTLIVLIHYFFFLFGGSISPEGINTNFYMDNNITLEKKGVFGDFTSGHFSILAFIWLAYGIFIQSREFKLQREEFENQTEQFKEQNKLYAQQMKELEIQSIQNQFDRKITKLTEIEKTIINQTLVNNDINIFIDECKRNNGLDQKISKMNSIEKFILLYENLNGYLVENINKIDLKNELNILKNDTYLGLKTSYIILVAHIIDKSNKQQSISLSLDTLHEIKTLQIYKDIEHSYVSISPNDSLSTSKHYISTIHLNLLNIFQKANS